MNKYKTILLNNETTETLEQMIFTRPLLSSKDFRMLVNSLLMYAAEGYYNNRLTMLVYKNNAPVMLVYAKTNFDGSTITTDIYVDNRYVYTKTIAC